MVILCELLVPSIQSGLIIWSVVDDTPGSWCQLIHQPVLREGDFVSLDLLGSHISCFQVLGGDSAVNGLVWVRGAQAEYDAYEQLGSPGWNWDNMYAAMKKVCSPVSLHVNKD